MDPFLFGERMSYKEFQMWTWSLVLITAFVVLTSWQEQAEAADKTVPLTTLSGERATIVLEDGVETESGLTITQCREDVFPGGYPVLICDGTYRSGRPGVAVFQWGGE